jgi:hypothetical protein
MLKFISVNDKIQKAFSFLVFFFFFRFLDFIIKRLKEICKIFKFVIRVLIKRKEDTCRGLYMLLQIHYDLCVHFRNKDN